MGCKLKDGVVGWITLKQDNNMLVTKSNTAFRDFCAAFDKAVVDADTVVKKASASVESKVRECGPAASGPLKDAKDEIIKNRGAVTAATTSLKELRQKCNVGKDAVKEKERAEKVAHIEAKEIAEAKVIYGAAIPKSEAAEAAAKAVDTAADALIKLTTKEELAALPSP